MPAVQQARQSRRKPIASRLIQRLALAAIVTLTGSQSLHTAIANGDTRTISLHHTHRGDDITVTFKRNGRYDEEALKKLNHFLRDWRTDDETKMDPQLFDAVWEVLREFGPDKSAHIISSYRSPRTNEMLRRRSNGVARHSLHMQGKAMDFYIPGVPLDKVREAGLRLQRGGVGFYPSSGSPFVHMDVGNVRHWPRMTREQLVRVFPSGRTVHLPADGKPLAGYALAQADIEKRASSPTFEAARVAANDGAKKPNMLARMLGLGKPKSGGEDASESAAAPTQVASAVPMPKSRPAAANVQLAAAATRPVPMAGAYRLAAITPNDVIRSRGYWQGLPESPLENSAARRRGTEIASADGATGSIGPFAAPPGYGRPRAATLAFASSVEPEDMPQRAKPMGAAVPRAAAVAANTTIAAKARPNAASEVQSAPPSASERRWASPWMRALILTPSVERFMNTTLYGIQDFRALQPMLEKPEETVLMGFAAEPNAGLSHQSFQGRAIEFPATATFRARSTAALR